jgi:hypothetical protein
MEEIYQTVFSRFGQQQYRAIEQIVEKVPADNIPQVWTARSEKKCCYRKTAS